MACPTVWPARLVPAPRGITGTPCSRGGGHHGGHVGGVTGEDDPDRRDRVHARVAGEQVPAVRVEPDLAADHAAQRFRELRAFSSLARPTWQGLGHVIAKGHTDGVPEWPACPPDPRPANVPDRCCGRWQRPRSITAGGVRGPGSPGLPGISGGGEEPGKLLPGRRRGRPGPGDRERGRRVRAAGGRGVGRARRQCGDEGSAVGVAGAVRVEHGHLEPGHMHRPAPGGRSGSRRARCARAPRGRPPGGPAGERGPRPADRCCPRGWRPPARCRSASPPGRAR